jgi:hypothetical protein
LSQDPDITLEDEPESSEICRDIDENSSSSVQRATDQDEQVVVEAITRKRTQPLPVFTPSKVKTPRQQDNVIRGAAVTTVDRGVQTDLVMYTKSIKTTPIVREQGRKIVTVKREKML